MKKGNSNPSPKRDSKGSRQDPKDDHGPAEPIPAHSYPLLCTFYASLRKPKPKDGESIYGVTNERPGPLFYHPSVTTLDPTPSPPPPSSSSSSSSTRNPPPPPSPSVLPKSRVERQHPAHWRVPEEDLPMGAVHSSGKVKLPPHLLKRLYQPPPLPLQPKLSSSSTSPSKDNDDEADHDDDDDNEDDDDDDDDDYPSSSLPASFFDFEEQCQQPYPTSRNLPRMSYTQSPDDPGPSIPYERPNEWSSSAASSNISIRPDSELFKNFRRQKPPKDDEIEIPGKFNIIQISDTIYNAVFDKVDRIGKSIYRIFECDIDDLKVNAEDLTIDCTVLDLNDDMRMETLYVTDQIDINAVLETIEVCNDVVDLTLSLKMITRDLYNTGICEGLKGVSMETLRDMDIHELMEKIPEGGFDETEMDLPMYDNTSIKESMKNFRREQSPEIVCVFCDTSSHQDKTLQFEVHPYVPQNFAKENVYFCAPCNANWKKYRDDARKARRLIFPGEKNEEICAICSDCPITDLILCSGCPKSFCDGCLRRVLTTDELEEVNDSSKRDWYCMCCNANNRKKTSSRSSSTGKSRVKGKSAKRSSSREDRGTDSERSTSRGKERDFSKKSSLPNSAIPELNDILLTSNPVYRNGTSNAGPEASEKLRGRRSSSAGSTGRGRRTETSFSNDLHTKDTSFVNDVNKGHKKGTRISTGAITSASLAARLMSEEIAESFEPVSVKGSGKDMGVVRSTSSSSYSRGRGSGRGRGRSRSKSPHGAINKDDVSLTSTNASNLLPVNKEMSEVDYFAQYVKVFEGVCRDCYKGKMPTLTEDTCFLCKDGGDLIECDHHFCKPSACRKVYHDYCMGFQGQLALDQEWMCMRHYCATCGGPDPYYICRYCPISICKRCPSVNAPSFYQILYAPVLTPPLPEHKGKDVQQIVCHQCLIMLNKAEEKKILSQKDLQLLGPIEPKLFAADAYVDVDFTDIYSVHKKQRGNGSRSLSPPKSRDSGVHKRLLERSRSIRGKGGRGRGGRGRGGRGRGGRRRRINDSSLLIDDINDSSMFNSSISGAYEYTGSNDSTSDYNENFSSLSSISNLSYTQSAYTDEDTFIDETAVGLAVEFVDHPELPIDVAPATLGRLVSGSGGMYEVQIQNQAGTVRVSPPCLTRPGQPYLWGCVHCGKNYKRQMWLSRHLDSQKKMGGPCYKPFTHPMASANGYSISKTEAVVNSRSDRILKIQSSDSVMNRRDSESVTHAQGVSSTNGSQHETSNGTPSDQFLRSNTHNTDSNVGSDDWKVAMGFVNPFESRHHEIDDHLDEQMSNGAVNPFRRSGHFPSEEIEYNSMSYDANPFRKASRLDYESYGDSTNSNGHP